MTDKALQKRIGKSLQMRRKTAGFKSARAFALHIGMNPSTYTEYEQGRNGFSFEQAWQFADALDCTLDELGGRDFSPDREYADPSQEALNGYYESMNADGRTQLVNTARLMSGSPDTRVEKNGERDVPVSQEVA